MTVPPVSTHHVERWRIELQPATWSSPGVGVPPTPISVENDLYTDSREDEPLRAALEDRAG
jgi:hypothetical protein